ncbi:MAG: DUF3040 domain-containing protein [Propionibacteriaceae bacterium]|jgi:hypothetical protein|nr:DUF3040 domain-containing protein [Propionibacteriaceae bacterium]
MALSKDEQRLLEEMEAALAAEDPKLASTLRGTTTRKLHRRRAALAGLGFLIGVGCLIGGMMSHFALSIAGFVIMLVSTIVALSSWQHVESGPVDAAAPKSPKSGSAFMEKMEDRWRKRQEEGR